MIAKWKRKKHETPQVCEGDEELSPLGLALLEQFAGGMSVLKLQLCSQSLCAWLVNLDIFVQQQLRDLLSRRLHSLQ